MLQLSMLAKYGKYYGLLIAIILLVIGSSHSMAQPSFSASIVASMSSKFPEGTLIMSDAPPPVPIFIMHNGYKEGIQSWNIFVSRGYSMDQVHKLPKATFDAIPAGPTYVADGMIVSLDVPDKPTFLVQGGKLRGIPDMETFNAMGLDFKNLLRLPADQFNAIPIGVPLPHRYAEHESNSCYLVLEMCQKYHYDEHRNRITDGNPYVCGTCLKVDF